MARPKKELDQEQFEKLCSYQCTKLEICDFLHVTDKTLDAWVKRIYGKGFSEVYLEKRSAGKISLRRAQFKLAERNAAMAIWLGKQYLGQRENKLDLEEQEARIEQLKANTERIRRNDSEEGEDELSNIEATFIRGNAGGFQMIYLYNPPKNPNAAINQWCKKMERRADCIHIHTDYRDVPVNWLGQDLVNSAEQMKLADEKMYRWVWLGEAVGVDELIYYMFGEKSKERPEEGRLYDRVYIGGDYGQMNATAFQAFGMDTYRKKFQGLGEYYHSGRDSGKQKSPSEYAKDLVGFMNSLHEEYQTRAFYVFLDPSAKGLAEEIKRATRSIIDY